MGETVKLTAKDGVTITAYKAAPAGKTKGAMVVLQEIFGVNHHIRSVTDRYAAQGYLAIAPGLFDRVGKDIELGYTQDDITKGADIRSKTRLDDTLADIEAAVKEVASAGTRRGRRLLLGRHARLCRGLPGPGHQGGRRLLRRRHRGDAVGEAQAVDHIAFRREG